MDKYLNENVFRASMKGDAKTVKKLLRKGAKPNVVDIHGWTPLLWASKKGSAETVEALLDNGAFATVFYEEDGAQDKVTPLHVAARNGHLEVVKLLCDRTGEVNYKDDEGRTALHYAVLSGNLNIIHLLFGEGIDPKITDNHGKTPLDLAREWGERDIVALLWEKCDYNPLDDLSHLAAKVEKSEKDLKNLSHHMDRKKEAYEVEIKHLDELIAILEKEEH